MNQTLDINTERGKIAAADQIVAAEMVFRSSENSWFVHTKTNDLNAFFMPFSAPE